MKTKKGILRYPLFFIQVYAMKRLLLCLLVVLFAGIALAEEQRIEVPLGDSPSLGPKDAPVTIVEFLDFQ